MKTLEFIEAGYFSSHSGMHSLTVDLDRICRVLSDAGVPFELVGGVGALAYIPGRDR